MPRRADAESKRKELLLKQAERRDESDRRSRAVLADENARREATAAKTAKLKALREAAEAGAQPTKATFEAPGRVRLRKGER
jgi:hypothetical protein